MPRHDRAYGFWYQPGRKSGTSKRTRIVRMGKGKTMGRKNQTPATPQAPKPPNDKKGTKHGR